MAKDRPIINFRFKVNIHNFFKGSFAKASGISSEIECEEYYEGGNNFSYKFPVKVKHYNITLEKGVFEAGILYEWFDKIKNGIVIKRDFDITLLNNEGKAVVKWSFNKGYPVKWEISELDAMGNSVLIEKIELAHEGMTQTKLSGK